MHKQRSAWRVAKMTAAFDQVATSPCRGYIITVWWQDGWTFLWYADSVPDETQIEAMRPGVRSLTCTRRP
jgi:hypothetical protein